jgi:hypothetical protein
MQFAAACHLENKEQPRRRLVDHFFVLLLTARKESHVLRSHERSRSSCSSLSTQSPSLAHVTAVSVLLVVRFVAVVMQSHAVEFFEWIRNLIARRGEAGIQRYALQLA